MRIGAIIIALVPVASYADQHHFSGQYTRAVISIAAQLFPFFYG
jgi:hypothetical protein